MSTTYITQKLTPATRRRKLRPLARFLVDGRIQVRLAAGYWTEPMRSLSIALFRALAPWQQEQIIEREFTLQRGFVTPEHNEFTFN